MDVARDTKCWSDEQQLNITVQHSNTTSFGFITSTNIASGRPLSVTQTCACQSILPCSTLVGDLVSHFVSLGWRCRLVWGLQYVSVRHGIWSFACFLWKYISQDKAFSHVFQAKPILNIKNTCSLNNRAADDKKNSIPNKLSVRHAVMPLEHNYIAKSWQKELNFKTVHHHLHKRHYTITALSACCKVWFRKSELWSGVFFQPKEDKENKESYLFYFVAVFFSNRFSFTIRIFFQKLFWKTIWSNRFWGMGEGWSFFRKPQNPTPVLRIW